MWGRVVSSDVSEVRIQAVERRVDGHEARLSVHDQRLSDYGQQQAVLSTEMVGISKDVSELVDELKSTNKKMDQRLSRLTQAAWGLFLVLVPIAVSLILAIANNGG